MALQGRHDGASSREGSCENSNLERQGCGPFYQDVIQDASVDLVSGLLFFIPSPYFFIYLFLIFILEPIYLRTRFEITSKMPQWLTRFKVFN